MSDQSQELAGLHVTVRQLTERIYRLEQVVAQLAPEQQAPERPAPAPERSRAGRARRASPRRAVGLPARARAAGDAGAGTG